MTIATILQPSGIASRAQILAAGATSYELGRAVHSGVVRRVRQGWYALPTARTDLVRAVRVGGALTAVSAALHRGLWAIDDGLLHVSVAQNGGRLRSPKSSKIALAADPTAGVCIHWRRWPGAEGEIIEPIEKALVHALECQSQEYAIASIDSALNKGLVTLTALQFATSRHPPSYLAALDRADPASQSGTESVVRLRLKARGISIRSQVARPAVGRVDFVIGDRLVLECDSRQHHTGAENYSRDRERDLLLVDGDDVVVRLTYEHVFESWDRVEPVILRLVRSRKHRGSRRRIQE